jgi:hypothetical protein
VNLSARRTVDDSVWHGARAEAHVVSPPTGAAHQHDNSTSALPVVELDKFPAIPGAYAVFDRPGTLVEAVTMASGHSAVLRRTAVLSPRAQRMRPGFGIVSDDLST